MRKFGCALFLIAATLPLSAQWKAGVARIAITPKEPIMLGGYGDRTHPSEGVRQELYAKALALQDGTGSTCLIVTLDLVGIPRDVAEPVAARCRTTYGIARDRLVLNASHTHSGPIVGQRLRVGYPLTDAHQVVIQRYTNTLIDRIVEVIGAAIKDVRPASLAFEQGFAGFAVNRRRVQLRDLPGPVDHDVPVLRVQSADGKLRAVVFGYACHATVLNDYLINGDWPGYAQAEMEKAHPEATFLFMAGCGADANPLPRRSVDLAVKYGQIMAAAVDSVLQGKMVTLAGPMKTAFETVDVPFAKLPSREEWRERLTDKSPAIRKHAQAMLDALDRDGKLPDRYPYPVEVWQFGKGLKLIALGGETVVDYSLRLKKQYGFGNTWVAGYSNDVFAYIPSLRVLKEGGYEGGGAMVGQGHPGPFGAAIEEIIVEKVGELVKRTE